MTTPDDAVAAAMADLTVAAPPSLRPNVLAEVGLADWFAPMASPIGPLLVAWNGLGVSTVSGASDESAFVARHWAETGRAAFRRAALPPRLASAIERRLDGDRHVRIDLDLRGSTPFEQAVWMKALEIPRGEVRPYGWIAAEIGRPRAVRAVGTALGHNPVPLIVPCHRVVRTDGTIGRYSLGGPDNKRTILRSEGLDPDGLEALASAGVRYFGSDTTRIMCLPTCRHAKRVTDRHRVLFRSFQAGLERGYRACKVCRPDSGAMLAA